MRNERFQIYVNVSQTVLGIQPVFHCDVEVHTVLQRIEARHVFSPHIGGAGDFGQEVRKAVHHTMMAAMGDIPVENIQRELAKPKPR